MNNSDQNNISPVMLAQRIQEIDILRGFAIFGILLVNMEFFNHSAMAYAAGLEKPSNIIDQVGRWLIAFFGEGKFYSTFAFLFGMGIAIQLQRSAERGKRFMPFFLRRMFVLLLIGLVHAYLFWVGDILILYSLLGTALALLFRKCRPKTLVRWTVAFLAVPILINGALYGLVALSSAVPEGQQMMADMFAEQERMYAERAQEANQVYAAGNFAQITRQRVKEMSFMFSIWPFMAFNVLAMIMLGFAAGKARFHENLSQRIPLLRKALLWGLVIGISGNLLYVIAGEFSSRIRPSALTELSLIGQTLGAPALALAYMSGLALLAQGAVWRARLSPLASVGRAAISNYLLQTLVCTTLFYGTGFGLYGKVGPAAGILLTAVIYTLQVPLSVWWLKRFRFGPVEWLWRTLTYGKRQPMRYGPGA